MVQFADNLPLDALTDSDLRLTAGRAVELGIRLEAGTRGIEPGHLLKYLEIARRLNARLLRTLTSTAASTPTIQEAARMLRKVLPAFEKAGVVIALENNEAHLVREYDWLMREVASPSLGICMDMVNSLGAGESTREVVEQLAPYTVCLHYKDFTIERLDHRMGFVVGGCAAGDGRVNGPWVLEKVADEGRDPNVIVELWTPWRGGLTATLALEDEWARRSVEYLKGAMAPYRI